MLTINEINGWSLDKCNEELGAACHYSLHNDVSEAREACIAMAKEYGILSVNNSAPRLEANPALIVRDE